MTQQEAHARYRRTLLLSLLGVLLLFVSVADTVLLALQRESLLQEGRAQMVSELGLVGALVREVLTRRDYAAATEFLDEWARGRADVSAVEAVMGNGFELLRYRRPGAPQGEALEQLVDYGAAGALTLRVHNDFSQLRGRLTELGLRYVAVSLICALFLGAVLWWLLQHRVLSPLERSVFREELRNRELADRLRGLMTHTPALIYLKDAAGRYIDANAAYADLFQRKVEDLVGRTDEEVLDAAHAFDAEDRRVLETGKDAHCELEVGSGDGRRIFLCHKFAIGAAGASGGAASVGSIAVDVTAVKNQSQALEYQVLHDYLTGLPNRMLLFDRLRQALANAKRGGRPLALFMMDLDRFKNINDTLGHRAGDRLLVEVARRLRSLPRENDTVARLSGDEFALVLPDTEAKGALVMAEKVEELMVPPVDLDGTSARAEVSIGVALYPTHGEDADSLLRCADVAMYQAKRSDRLVEIYSPSRDRTNAESGITTRAEI